MARVFAHLLKSRWHTCMRMYTSADTLEISRNTSTRLIAAHMRLKINTHTNTLGPDALEIYALLITRHMLDVNRLSNTAKSSVKSVHAETKLPTLTSFVSYAHQQYPSKLHFQK